jgi:hypothetical protein
MPQRDIEKEILAPFDDVVNRLSLNSNAYRKRTRDNRITLYGRVDFEFGGLRVDLKACHVVVEAETGAMIGNLVKYWYLLEKGLIDKPIVLFHLYSSLSR